MAAAAGGGSMLQILRQRQRRQLSRRDSKDIRQQIQQQIQPRQDAPAPTEGVAVTTLVLTETLITPSATLTQILTIAPPTTTNPLPSNLLPDENTSSDTASLSTVGDDMATTSISHSSNAVHSNTSKSTTMVSSPTAAGSAPPSTRTPDIGATRSGVDIKALVPAIVGGAIFLVIVAFILGYCVRRRRNRRYEEEDYPDDVVNELDVDRGYNIEGYSAEGDAAYPYGTETYGIAESRVVPESNEKQQPQATSRNIPDINIDQSHAHARNRSLSKGTSQSKEGLLSDVSKLGPDGATEREKRNAMAMFRRSTAQDSATIPHHLRHLRPESVSTDGLRNISDEGDFSRGVNQPGTERISKIGMALSTSDKSIQEDNISAVLHEEPRPPPQARSGPFQGSHTMFFEETPPLYSVTQGSYFGGAGSASKSTMPPRTEQPPDFGTVGSGHSSNQSRFAGRSDIATPSPPGTPTRDSRDNDRDTSTSSRRSSRRGSGIFGLAAATLATASETRKTRPKSWDRKGRRWDRKRHSRGRGVAAPAGLEKRKPNKSRSRSRSNAVWTAWFDSSSEGEEEQDGDGDVIEPIPLPGGIVTSKSQRKKRVLFNSTSDISENPTVSSSRTLTNSNA
ncbi:hypothetical protein H072_2276 [Dactylellina haptotyla CBS 200.50]|uniref:Uncharacterized protein n=1 Tax=Dactylellina haptotyla (strain CBS 200.50) TaxID=1284197 RepID=S8ARV0_DACHA|nr:hypothetical protein H072_2276 [Dactylellina haptotyla CBS 200.50]